MIAFAMALLGCVLIMYKAIWYDQFTCPDGFLLRVRPGQLGVRGRG